MSLFENDQFHWRETYFVFFEEGDRPTAEELEAALKQMGARYEVDSVRKDDNGHFESITLISPHDFAAMDITYITGDEVTEKVTELNQEMKNMTLNSEELEKVSKMNQCNARFDVYHFEQITGDPEDEFLDPGALLIVLERLTELCRGVTVDPQTNTVM